MYNVANTLNLVNSFFFRPLKWHIRMGPIHFTFPTNKLNTIIKMVAKKFHFLMAPNRWYFKMEPGIRHFRMEWGWSTTLTVTSVSFQQVNDIFEARVTCCIHATCPHRTFQFIRINKIFSLVRSLHLLISEIKVLTLLHKENQFRYSIWPYESM